MKDQNISYGELSKRTKISKSSLQRYVMQGGKIPINRMMMIAKALNTSPSYLLEWDETELIDESDKEFLKWFGDSQAMSIKDQYIPLKNLLNTFGYDLGMNENGYYLLGDNGVSSITEDEVKELHSNTVEFLEFSVRKLLKEKLK